MKVTSCSVLLVLAVLALGCGQKGPLLLPDAAPKHKRVPSHASPSAPAAEAPAAQPASTAKPKDAPDSTPAP